MESPVQCCGQGHVRLRDAKRPSGASSVRWGLEGQKGEPKVRGGMVDASNWKGAIVSNIHLKGRMPALLVQELGGTFMYR